MHVTAGLLQYCAPLAIAVLSAIDLLWTATHPAAPKQLATAAVHASLVVSLVQLLLCSCRCYRHKLLLQPVQQAPLASH